MTSIQFHRMWFAFRSCCVPFMKLIELRIAEYNVNNSVRAQISNMSMIIHRRGGHDKNTRILNVSFFYSFIHSNQVYFSVIRWVTK